MYDLIIVGGSVAGLSLAREVSGNVLLLEGKDIGEPIQCSGLYSSNIEKFVPEDALEAITEHTVTGARLHSPGGKEIQLKKDRTAAYVVDRSALDKYIRSEVDIPIETGKMVTDITVSDDGVTVTAGEEFRAQMIAGCDGPHSIIGKSLGAQPQETINGIIALVEEDGTQPFVEVWIDKNHLYDGFFWKVPRGNVVEYGAFAHDATYQKLEEFFQVSQYQKRAGVIPFGPPQTVFNRAILLGDAAAQVKPWSGGGVIYSMTAAKFAGSVIQQCIQTQNFSARALQPYQDQWKKAFGKRIDLGMHYRGVFRRMGNRQLDLLFSLVGKLPLNHLDMDFPDLSFAKKLMRI